MQNTELPEEMRLNSQGYLIGKVHRQCTNCKSIFKITSKTVTLCNTCNTERVKSQSVEYKMYQRAKQRARIKNIEFDLLKSDISIPTHCPILNIPLIVTKGKSGSFNNSPSLDKINPKKGYTKDNIIVISSLANVMKNNATKEELLQFANWVIKNYSNFAQN
jgi:hypothetical protein